MQHPKNLLLLLGFGMVPCALYGQTKEIVGSVKGNDNLENIHVINSTSKQFTVTNAQGVFTIPVKLQDTVVFSGIQYSTKEVIIDPSIFNSKVWEVHLDDHVNQLSEVLVGKVLTGNLLLDVQNATAKPEINFYDVGIPGYQGKQKTQAERRLYEATTGGGIVPLNPVINAITGRTKMLKQHVDLERRDDLMHRIKARLSDDFFSKHPLKSFSRMDFWYFCADDPDFMKRCKNKRDIEILAFLNLKYKQYLNNQKQD